MIILMRRMVMIAILAASIHFLLVDVRNGVPFPDAFRSRFGMSLSEYKNRFFDLRTSRSSP